MAFAPIEELPSLLAAAVERLECLGDLNRPAFTPAANIRTFLLQCLNAMARGRLSHDQIEELWVIFAPTGDWDDAVSEPDLANRIFEVLDVLHQRDVNSNKI